MTIYSGTTHGPYSQSPVLYPTYGSKVLAGFKLDAAYMTEDPPCLRNAISQSIWRELPPVMIAP